MKKLILASAILTSLLLGSEIAIDNKYMVCTDTDFIPQKTEFNEDYILVQYSCLNRDENKTIVGFVQNLVFKDVFGKVLYEDTTNIVKTLKCKDVLPIRATAKDNPFVRGELYDILLPSVENNSTQSTLFISKILYDDGSSVEIKD